MSVRFSSTLSHGLGTSVGKIQTYVNLFVYSSIADDRCALRSGMTPIAAFHVISAVNSL